MDDTVLREMLHEAAANEPPLGPVVERAVSDGRRVKRRRRVLSAAGGLAVAAVAAVAVVVLPASGGTHVVGASGSSASSASSVSAASSASSASSAGGGQQCGTLCDDPYVKAFGAAFRLDVYKQAGKTGQPVILFAASNANPGEDWTINTLGTVSSLYKKGLGSAAMTKRYGTYKAYEIEYTPHGTSTGLCAGVPVASGAEVGVQLQRCGLSVRTVWFSDGIPAAKHSVPLINGSSKNAADPLALTYPSGAYPTDVPRPALLAEPLHRLAHGGYLANQLWG